MAIRLWRSGPWCADRGLVPGRRSMPSLKMYEICWSLRFFRSSLIAPAVPFLAFLLMPFSSTARISLAEELMATGIGHAEEDFLVFLLSRHLPPPDEVAMATRMTTRTAGRDPAADVNQHHLIVLFLHPSIRPRVMRAEAAEGEGPPCWRAEALAVVFAVAVDRAREAQDCRESPCAEPPGRPELRRKSC